MNFYQVGVICFPIGDKVHCHGHELWVWGSGCQTIAVILVSIDLHFLVVLVQQLLPVLPGLLGRGCVPSGLQLVAYAAFGEGTRGGDLNIATMFFPTPTANMMFS